VAPLVTQCSTELHRPSFVPVVATVAADDEGNFLNAAWQGGAGHHNGTLGVGSTMG